MGETGIPRKTRKIGTNPDNPERTAKPSMNPEKTGENPEQRNHQEAQNRMKKTRDTKTNFPGKATPRRLSQKPQPTPKNHKKPHPKKHEKHLNIPAARPLTPPPPGDPIGTVTSKPWTKTGKPTNNPTCKNKATRNRKNQQTTAERLPVPYTKAGRKYLCGASSSTYKTDVF